MTTMLLDKTPIICQTLIQIAEDSSRFKNAAAIYFHANTASDLIREMKPGHEDKSFGLLLTALNQLLLLLPEEATREAIWGVRKEALKLQTLKTL